MSKNDKEYKIYECIFDKVFKTGETSFDVFDVSVAGKVEQVIDAAMQLRKDFAIMNYTSKTNAIEEDEGVINKHLENHEHYAKDNFPNIKKMLDEIINNLSTQKSDETCKKDLKIFEEKWKEKLKKKNDKLKNRKKYLKKKNDELKNRNK